MAVSTFVILKAIDRVKGLRVVPRIEEEGLDLHHHSAVGYVDEDEAVTVA